MSGNRERTMFIGNLDERVSERALYDICIQAGRVVNLYIPRDRETDRPKGIAFAEYESEEIAEYAVKLFSGLITLYNRTLRFAISGQDRASSNVSAASTGTPNQSQNLRAPTVQSDMTENSQHPAVLSTPCRSMPSRNYSEGVTNEPDGHGSHSYGHNYDYSRRVFGSTLDSSTRTRSSRN
ncbi:spliceosome-associated protein 49 [Punica granatum]|uniref:RRM domain-containing protein n=2 Tax=Punica granatum TaxID=22663 RepID=A0A218W4I7_PUNGR|nr:spliceosome-associated protein 49 [Punica granatum]OWM67546.1 hypothetical protein CDL15_Pgr028409 [Punica granatum]PKI41163.1 hypothetical protein CRG98_038448 [Punica granatum]